MKVFFLLLTLLTMEGFLACVAMGKGGDTKRPLKISKTKNDLSIKLSS